MKKRSWFSLKGKLKTTLLGGLFVLATSLSFGQATLPYSEDFTASTGWTFANGTETNQWHIGSATGNTGNSLYISENGGLTNTYKIFGTPSVISKVHAYKQITFPAGSNTFNLQFDWKSKGESDDRLRVWVVPSTFTPTAGALITAAGGNHQIGGNFFNTTAWTTANYVIPASFAGTTARLVFEWANDGYSGDNDPAAIDNIIVTGISCAAPTALNVTGKTLTTATLAWTPNGAATSWEVVTVVPGAAASTGTPTAATTNPFTITGLTANTSYDYFVRSVCSASDKSTWSGPFNFRTGYCTVSTTSTGDYISAFSTSGAVNNITYAATTQPSGSYADATTQNFSSFAGQIIGFTQSYHQAGPNNFMIWVDWNNDLDFNDVGEEMYSFNGTPHASNFQVPTTIANGTYRMRIRASWNVAVLNPCGGVTYGSTVDFNLVIATPPSCIDPSALTATTITENSATIEWTENGVATEWDIESGLAGFTPTGNPTSSVTANPTTLNGLLANTTYEYYVRSKCDLTLNSAWVGPFSFTTSQSLAQLPYTDDFSTNQWTFVNGNENNKWYIGSAVGNPANSMYISQNGGLNNSYNEVGFSITQAYRNVSFPAGTSTFRLKFDWKANGEKTGGVADDYLSVWVVPFGSTITAGTQIDPVNNPGAVRLGAKLLLSNTWVLDYEVVIPNSFQGTNAHIVFEWRNDGGSGAQDPAAIDNVNISVISCPAPMALTATNFGTTTADLSWTTSSPSTDFEIQYGLATYLLNNGPITTVTGTTHTLTGLQPASTYDYYVRTKCGLTDSSTWSGPFRFSTECDVITTLPWTENFDLMTMVGYGIFPTCWVDENVGDWYTAGGSFALNGETPNSGPNALHVGSESNAKIWAPQFELVAGETYEFSFRWAGDTGYGWNGSVYANTSQTSLGAITLGSFVALNDTTVLGYKKEKFCFTPTVSGVHSFGLYVSDANNENYLSFDDFELKLASASAGSGTDGVATVCQIAAPVDLNTVATINTTEGTWNNATFQSSITGNMLDLTNVTAGVHQFLFITDGCLPDTTIATITVDAKSSAGIDGTLQVCRKEPMDLFQGLTGTVDAGGVWTNPNGVVVPNGLVTSSNIPGQYNFQYIVSNGSCAGDTSKVVVVVTGCEYVGLEDVAFVGFNMYPNPSSDIVYIANTGSTEVFNYEVLDMNGRVILSAENAINGSTTTELNLSNVKVGIYLIRVFNANANKTFRVVKN